MKREFARRVHDLFGALESLMVGRLGQRALGTATVALFLLTIGLIEAGRWGLLPPWLAGVIPVRHLFAIEIAFTFLLIIEVIGLVFSISRSFSTSVGKQLEILSLILLRDVFKEVSHFSEPIAWEEVVHSLPALVADSLSALTIFGILAVYYRVKKSVPIAKDERDQEAFIVAKKFVALFLVAGFHLILAKGIWLYVSQGRAESPFAPFYTMLVFTDILLVLLSIRYGHSYKVAFRNSGFAVVTVFIRLALMAPPVTGAFISVGSALFALGIIWLYNCWAGEKAPAETTVSPSP